MDANPSTAHMFIVNPLKGKNIMSLFSTHPATEDRKKKLEELATSQLKDFKGIDISTVSRDSVNKIVGLEQKEAGKFLNELFSSTSKDGMVKLEDKVVLYRINSSKFADYNKTKDDVVKQSLIQLQEEELMTNLIKKLENSFEIQSSIQEKE